MSPEIADLIEALPVEPEEAPPPSEALQNLIEDLAQRKVPTGRLSRFWVLGTLQAKIAAAYAAWWIRSGYASADERERLLNETHLKAAMKVLGGMGYLRGAIMKLGQILANYPEVVPQEFADTLGRLQFQAPPMHFSLLREFVRAELGDDPEVLFDDFETTAFAAASLGQVHRARLKGSGRPVAVKIQYPNIGRTIRDDFRNFQALVTPMRLNGDWENLKLQFEDIRRMLERETDYEQEAENLRRARLAFGEEDEIVVPRVHAELSTRRVLTMDFIEGVHLPAFLATNPSQAVRDRHGHQIALSAFRLSYGAHLNYADPQPGNYFFMPDGRLGLVDFGCCNRYTAEDLDYLTEVEQGVHTGGDALRRAIIRASDMTPNQQTEEQRLAMIIAFSKWIWEPLLHEGTFDFSDGSYFRRGVEHYGECMRKRYIRSLPLNTWLTRCFYGVRAMLTHLKARVDMGLIYRQETTVRLAS